MRNRGSAIAAEEARIPNRMLRFDVYEHEIRNNGDRKLLAKNIKPETFATLVQMARDVYPHDKIADKYYAMVVEGLDAAAGKSKDDKFLLEDGVAELNKAASGSYMNVGWEADRVTLLKGIETSGFFQKVRGSLVTGIYNNKDLWPLFGYEGESASEGGYIERGFDDINWLDAV